MLDLRGASVLAGSTVANVHTLATEEHVVAAAAAEHVVTLRAPERFGPVAAEQRVRERGAGVGLESTLIYCALKNTATKVNKRVKEIFKKEELLIDKIELQNYSY